jgi:hypothetical protein
MSKRSLRNVSACGKILARCPQDLIRVAHRFRSSAPGTDEAAPASRVSFRFLDRCMLVSTSRIDTSYPCLSAESMKFCVIKVQPSATTSFVPRFRKPPRRCAHCDNEPHCNRSAPSSLFPYTEGLAPGKACEENLPKTTTDLSDRLSNHAARWPVGCFGFAAQGTNSHSSIKAFNIVDFPAPEWPPTKTTLN